jgi:hypothetical protein
MLRRMRGGLDAGAPARERRPPRVSWLRMEHAPLRPVPSRAAGPIDAALAAREVAAALPALSPVEARALALVALAERPRAQAAALLRIDDDTLADALVTARKELRRTVTSLPGSGWCERAERLISDRLDGTPADPNPLGDRDARRLDAHLRNCPRCVEHERRLVQATDALAASIAAGLTPAPPPPTTAPELAERSAEAPDPAEAPEPPAEAPDPPAEPDEPSADAPEPAEPAAEHAPAVVAPADVAAAAEVLVAARTRRQVAAALTWNALIILAVLLALVTIGFTVAGILGAGI